MSHRNARTTFHGRLLMVRRYQAGWAKAHIAKAMGVSRKCVQTWITRYETDGEAGLVDRSSRPHTTPSRTPRSLENQIVAWRRRHRCGPDEISAKLGVARTVSRVLRRRGMPYLCDCDPMTGAVIRASKSTAVRYERARPGELVHMDVKKLGRIPEGGGWRAHGRGNTGLRPQPAQRVRLRPLSRRRPLPAGLQRDPARRERPHLRGILAPGRRILPQPRHHHDRAGHDRQRLGLPVIATPGLH